MLLHHCQRCPFQGCPSLKEGVAVPPPPFPTDFVFVAPAGLVIVKSLVFPRVIFNKVGDEQFSRFWAEGLDDEQASASVFRTIVDHPPPPS